MRQKLVVAVLCAIFGACSCGPAVTVPPPPAWPVYVTEFHPPQEYREWYKHAEECVGMKGNFDAITWAFAEKPWGDPKLPTYGEWRVTRDERGFVKRAQIEISATLWTDSMLIRHESIHDILWRNGFEAPNARAGASRRDSLLLSHPVPPFREKREDKGCAPIFYPWFGDST